MGPDFILFLRGDETAGEWDVYLDAAKFPTIFPLGIIAYGHGNLLGCGLEPLPHLSGTFFPEAMSDTGILSPV